MKMNKLVLATLLACALPIGTSLADQAEPYGVRFNIGGMYQNRDQSYGVVDAFIPVWQRSSVLWFTDVRGLNRQGPSVEGNLGTGVRWMNAERSMLYGIYAFYDFKHTDYSNNYSQITLGSEFKTQHWALTVNGYAPIGVTSRTNVEHNSIKEVTHGSYENIVYDADTEQALYGGDADVAYTIPGTDGLTVHAGGYYFSGNHASFGGPRGMLDYKITNSDGSRVLGIFDSITIEAGSQYDKYRNFAWFTGARFAIGISDSNRHLTGLAKRMVDYVQRDPDVVTADQSSDNLALRNADGSAVNIEKVHNNAELQQALADPKVNVIAVEGNIDDNQDAQLAANKYLTGGGFDYQLNGHNYFSQLSQGGSLTASNGINTLLTVGDDTIIRDLSFYGSSKANQIGLALQGHNIQLSNITVNGFDGNQAQAIVLHDGDATIKQLTLQHDYYGIYSSEMTAGHNFTLNVSNLIVDNVDQALYLSTHANNQDNITIDSGSISHYIGDAITIDSNDQSQVNFTMSNIVLNGSSQNYSMHSSIATISHDNSMLNATLNGVTVENNDGRDGMYVAAVDDANVNLTIENSNFTSNWTGLEVDNLGYKSIVNTTISDSKFNYSTYADGAEFYSRNGMLTNINISNSDFNGNNRYGLVLVSSYGSMLKANITSSTFDHDQIGIYAINESYVPLGMAVTLTNDTLEFDDGNDGAGFYALSTGNLMVEANNTDLASDATGYHFISQGSQANVSANITGGADISNYGSTIIADNEGESVVVNVHDVYKLGNKMLKINGGQINISYD